LKYFFAILAPMEPIQDDNALYIRSIGAARRELEAINGECDRLGKRKAQLEAFIANAEPLLPRESDAPTLRFPEPTNLNRHVMPAPAQMPMWRAIVFGINGKKQRFTVGDAIAALDRIGRPVTSKNKFQIVRAELKRKTDVFESVGTGVYAVKGDDQAIVN
jgi:hypothetical protein